MTKVNLSAIRIAIFVLAAVCSLGIGQSTGPSPQSGESRKVRLSVWSYLVLPSKFTAYLDQTVNEFRKGCFVTDSGRVAAVWSTEPYRPPPSQPIKWARSEVRGTVRLEMTLVSPAGGPSLLYIDAASWGVVAFVANHEEEEEWIAIAGSTAAVGRDQCKDCQHYEALAPTYELGLRTASGCSLPLAVQTEPSAESIVFEPDPFRALGRFEAFAPYFKLTDHLAVEPICSGAILIGLIVDAPTRTIGADIVMPHYPDLDSFWTVLKRLDAIQSLGLPGKLGWPIYSALPGSSPIHAVFKRGVLDARVQGGDDPAVWGFRVLFFRPVSGLVEQVRRPVGGDSRTAFMTGGKWFWAVGTEAEKLRVGTTVRDVAAAGPADIPMSLYQPSNCQGV